MLVLTETKDTNNAVVLSSGSRTTSISVVKLLGIIVAAIAKLDSDTGSSF